AAPSHEALFRSKDGRERYELAEGEDRLEVPLLWTDPSGVSVRKVLVLERGSYAVTVRQEIRNEGELPWRGYGYLQLQRVAPPEHTSELQSREKLVCRLLLEKKNNYGISF